MRWAAKAVAQFAVDAGFPPDVIAEAVTLAIAGTGGEDGRRYEPPPGMGPLEVGLWLIPIFDRDGWRESDLIDPRANAAAAYQLWVGAGRSFAWSPTWRAGLDRIVRDDVAEALAAPGAADPVLESIGPPKLSQAFSGLRGAVSETVRTMIDGPRRFR